MCWFAMSRSCLVVAVALNGGQQADHSAHDSSS
jgi:hypothetical protein